MHSISVGAGLLVAAIFASSAIAQESDLAQGAELYRSQCMICHGKITAPETTDASNIPSQLGPILVAIRQGAAEAMSDISAGLISAAGESVQGTAAGDRGSIAFAPPFGPNLRGVVGRRAGTVEGFSYSQTFMSTLAGMDWNEAALNVWITNPQAWVPGVYMFYKQPDPEIRRKIILYLKANP